MKTVLLTLIVSLMLLPVSARAEGGATRIATANPSRIFKDMQETKDRQKANTGERVALQHEADGKADDIQKMVKDRDALYRKGQPDYNSKTQEILKKRVEFQVWQELKKTEMTRRGKDDTKAVFIKIQEAISEIAAERKIDLVVTDSNIDFPDDLDAITPEQLQQLLERRNVLYAAKGVDISAEVTARLDAAYKPKTK